eukprot:comp20860_c0_seq1/m.27614 comp20860_c0_seq1/g.27614  ORF comp20860_c0_seq1/g.27614 comp20860_c0_seq1/m.27614 type:complete len:197 (-) comp20860_c0_seq1:778-1368(-)
MEQYGMAYERRDVPPGPMAPREWLPSWGVPPGAPVAQPVYSHPGGPQYEVYQQPHPGYHYYPGEAGKRPAAEEYAYGEHPDYKRYRPAYYVPEGPRYYEGAYPPQQHQPAAPAAYPGDWTPTNASPLQRPMSASTAPTPLLASPTTTTTIASQAEAQVHAQAHVCSQFLPCLICMNKEREIDSRWRHIPPRMSHSS